MEDLSHGLSALAEAAGLHSNENNKLAETNICMNGSIEDTFCEAQLSEVSNYDVMEVANNVEIEDACDIKSTNTEKCEITNNSDSRPLCDDKVLANLNAESNSFKVGILAEDCNSNDFECSSDQSNLNAKSQNSPVSNDVSSCDMISEDADSNFRVDNFDDTQSVTSNDSSNDDENVQDHVNYKDLPYADDEIDYAYRMLQEIMDPSHEDINWPFMDEVSSNIEGLWDYDEIIKKPMWLTRVEEKILNHDYPTITLVVADLRLILENCYVYHGPNHSMTRKALKLESLMESKITKWPQNISGKCTLEVTSGKPLDDVTAILNRRKTRKEDSYFSHVLHRVRHAKSERLKEYKKKLSDERKLQREEKEKSVIEWEAKELIGFDGQKCLLSMWELPQMGHFLYLLTNKLQFDPLPQYEIERMFFMPQASTGLCKLLTALLKFGNRKDFEGKPAMPYSIWTYKLSLKVKEWYRVYNKEGKNASKAFEVLGIEEPFWTLVGHQNPFETMKFQELSYQQKVWLIKTLCDYMLHKHKTVQDAINEQSMPMLREQFLGKDRLGNSYLYFPIFLNTDLRIYRQAPWIPPQIEISKDYEYCVMTKQQIKCRKQRRNVMKKKGSGKDASLLDSPNPRQRPERLRQKIAPANRYSDMVDSDDESDEVKEDSYEENVVRTTRLPAWFSLSTSATANTNNVINSNPTTTPKKRGRPPKIRKPVLHNEMEINPSIQTPVLSKSQDLSHSKNIETSVPKKRGRPRKKNIVTPVKSVFNHEIVIKSIIDDILGDVFKNDGTDGLIKSEKCTSQIKVEQEGSEIKNKSSECDTRLAEAKSKDIDTVTGIEVELEKEEIQLEDLIKRKDVMKKEEVEFKNDMDEIVMDVKRLETEIKSEAEVEPTCLLSTCLPDPSKFELVVESVESLRNLIENLQSDINSTAKTSTERDHKNLLKSLNQLLEELEPFEARLLVSTRKLRNQLLKEWTFWKNRDTNLPEPGEEAWVSDPEPEAEPEPVKPVNTFVEEVEDSLSDEKQYDEPGTLLSRRKYHRRRVKRKRVVVDSDDEVGKDADNDPSDTWEIEVSARGRTRKVRKFSEWHSDEEIDMSSCFVVKSSKFNYGGGNSPVAVRRVLVPGDSKVINLPSLSSSIASKLNAPRQNSEDISSDSLTMEVNKQRLLTYSYRNNKGSGASPATSGGYSSLFAKFKYEQATGLSTEQPTPTSVAEESASDKASTPTIPTTTRYVGRKSIVLPKSVLHGNTTSLQTQSLPANSPLTNAIKDVLKRIPIASKSQPVILMPSIDSKGKTVLMRLSGTPTLSATKSINHSVSTINNPCINTVMKNTGPGVQVLNIRTSSLDPPDNTHVMSSLHSDSRSICPSNIVPVLSSATNLNTQTVTLTTNSALASAPSNIAVSNLNNSNLKLSSSPLQMIVTNSNSLPTTSNVQFISVSKVGDQNVLPCNPSSILLRTSGGHLPQAVSLASTAQSQKVSSEVQSDDSGGVGGNLDILQAALDCAQISSELSVGKGNKDVTPANTSHNLTNIAANVVKVVTNQSSAVNIHTAAPSVIVSQSGPISSPTILVTSSTQNLPSASHVTILPPQSAQSAPNPSLGKLVMIKTADGSQKLGILKADNSVDLISSQDLEKYGLASQSAKVPVQTL